MCLSLSHVCLSFKSVHSPTGQVQELLPSLGAGFISECLKACNGDSERMINAYLSGSLPEQVVSGKVPNQQVETVYWL